MKSMVNDIIQGVRAIAVVFGLLALLGFFVAAESVLQETAFATLAGAFFLLAIALKR